MPINITTSKQLHTPPFPAYSSQLKHLSIVVYLATAWRSWIQCISMHG